MTRPIIAALALLATPALAQQAELEKARTEVNTVENAADRAVYACSRNQQPKCTDEARTAANAASRALYAIDKAIEAQPGHEHPAPVPDERRYPKVGDIQPIVSDLDIDALLGPKRIPPSNKPDVVGAFRMLCGPGQTLYDDPIVYPGQPGKAHLHEFFGNLEADANSTYESLRTTGESTCNNELYRSSSWMPALLYVFQGEIKRLPPSHITIYYKRRPEGDPQCKLIAIKCVGLPASMKFIRGYDMARAGVPQPENQEPYFKCVDGSTPVSAASINLVEPLKNCKAGMRLNATIHTLPCWDGVWLDTPDHRSHLARTQFSAATGYKTRCPASHPYLIPVFTFSPSWTIPAGIDTSKLRFSSDMMYPGAPPGTTFHMDYWEAQEPEFRLRYEAACIDGFRNCSDGDLGDGAIMKRGPHYPYGVAEPRLVPVPERK